MAWDWGNVGAGAAAGWGLGSFGGPVGMGSGALLGGIAGLFGGGGQEGTPESYEVMYAKDYPWMTQAYEDLTSYGMGEVARSRAGKAPQWWEKLRPQVTEQAMGDLSRQYLGTEAGMGPGILDYQKSFDVSRGLGRGAGATAGMGAQLEGWGQKAKDISTYIAGLTGQYSQRAAEDFPGMVAGLPQGPRVAGMAHYAGQPGEPSQFQQISSSVLQALPWLQGTMDTAAGWDGGGASYPDYQNLPGTAPTSATFPQGFAGYGTGGANLMGSAGGWGGAPPPATVSQIPPLRTGGAGEWFGDVGQSIRDWDWGQKLYNAPWTNIGSDIVNWWMGYDRPRQPTSGGGGW